MAAPILWFDSLGSTNAEARRRAEDGEAGPLWIAARRQTAGRGRRGRNWETPAGNLAATLLMVTDKTPAEAAQVSFIAALAVGDLVRASVDATVGLKWPNDVMIAGRKVCGILVESGRRPDGLVWLAVGIGVNLAFPPVASERPTTAIAEHSAHPPAPEAALDALAAAFARWLAVWAREGFPAIAKAWTANAHGLGQPCVARLGQETIEGVAEGLDPDGALRLRLADGTLRRITAGDVFFGEA